MSEPTRRSASLFLASDSVCPRREESNASPAAFASSARRLAARGTRRLFPGGARRARASFSSSFSERRARRPETAGSNAPSGFHESDSRARVASRRHREERVSSGDVVRDAARRRRAKRSGFVSFPLLLRRRLRRHRTARRGVRFGDLVRGNFRPDSDSRRLPYLHARVHADERLVPLRVRPDVGVRLRRGVAPRRLRGAKIGARARPRFGHERASHRRFRARSSCESDDGRLGSSRTSAVACRAAMIARNVRAFPETRRDLSAATPPPSPGTSPARTNASPSVRSGAETSAHLYSFRAVAVPRAFGSARSRGTGGVVPRGDLVILRLSGASRSASAGHPPREAREPPPRSPPRPRPRVFPEGVGNERFLQELPHQTHRAFPDAAQPGAQGSGAPGAAPTPRRRVSSTARPASLRASPAARGRPAAQPRARRRARSASPAARRGRRRPAARRAAARGRRAPPGAARAETRRRSDRTPPATTPPPSRRRRAVARRPRARRRGRECARTSPGACRPSWTGSARRARAIPHSRRGADSRRGRGSSRPHRTRDARRPWWFPATRFPGA